MNKKTGNERKAELLGQPYGTANSKLRKMLLFHFAKKLGLTKCYRCGLEIDSIDDFSIEHMKAWSCAENPVESFFDVENNISFSHIKCNCGAGNKLRKVYNSNLEKVHANYARQQADPERRKLHLETKKKSYHKNKGK